MIYNIVIPPIIEAKIRDQALHIALDKPSAAQKWYDAIYEHIYSLSEFPSRCPMAPENERAPFEIKHLISGNYRILFRITEDKVVIIDFKERHQM